MAEVTSEMVSQKLDQLARMSKFFRCAFLALAICMLVIEIVIFTVVLLGGQEASSETRIADCLPVFAQLLIFISVFIIASNLFKGISRGESPFGDKPARKVRIIAWLFLAYTFFDAIGNGLFVATSVFQNEIPLEVWHNTTPVFTINLTGIALSLLFFSLSIIFKYGGLLQKVSDDTI